MDVFFVFCFFSCCCYFEWIFVESEHFTLGNFFFFFALFVSSSTLCLFWKNLLKVFLTEIASTHTLLSCILLY